jgi:hypothetical protein
MHLRFEPLDWNENWLRATSSYLPAFERRRGFGFWSLFVATALSRRQEVQSARSHYIDFTQAEQAILVFSLPKLELHDVEVSIYQETRLVWNQSLAIPQQKLFGENLVTFLLKSSAVGKGNYRMTVQGNPTGKRVELKEFDMAIES